MFDDICRTLKQFGSKAAASAEARRYIPSFA
jgi:hypothetical protein